MYKDINYSDFFLLLLYSLLPGIYKIIGNQIFMIISVPITLILLIKNKAHISLYKIDLPFIFLLCYLFLLCIIQFFVPSTNRVGLFMGIYLDMIPMAGYLYSRKIPFEQFAKITIYIGLIHLLIGILLYPLFKINTILGSLVPILREGVAYGRMSSVSGSLGFAALMFISSIFALYYNRKLFFILLIGVVCAAQRSGWLACVWGIFFYLIYNMKKYHTAALWKWLFGLVFFIILTKIVVTQYNINLSFLLARLDDLQGAIQERDGQWIAGLKNFLMMPIGSGPGQVGQVAARYEASFYNTVPDGDYFRILSEYGICGGLFYLIIFFFLMLGICGITTHSSVKRACLLSLFGGMSIQMIGSNITEFYFTNFIYWILLGYFFSDVKSFFHKNGSTSQYRMTSHIY